MTTTKQIRKEMKQTLGYNTKQVSVRDMDGLILFTVRDRAVNFRDVEEFATNFEVLKRDHATGDVLRYGANTFVQVRLSDELQDEASCKYLDIIRNGTANAEEDEMVRVSIEGERWLVGRSRDGSIKLDMPVNDVYPQEFVNAYHVSDFIYKENMGKPVDSKPTHIETNIAGNNMVLI